MPRTPDADQDETTQPNQGANAPVQNMPSAPDAHVKPQQVFRDWAAI